MFWWNKDDKLYWGFIILRYVKLNIYVNVFVSSYSCNYGWRIEGILYVVSKFLKLGRYVFIIL